MTSILHASLLVFKTYTGVYSSIFYVAGDVESGSSVASNNAPMTEELAALGYLETASLSQISAFSDLAPAGPLETAIPAPEALSTMPLVSPVDMNALDPVHACCSLSMCKLHTLTQKCLQM